MLTVLMSRELQRKPYLLVPCLLNQSIYSLGLRRTFVLKSFKVRSAQLQISHPDPGDHTEDARRRRQ